MKILIADDDLVSLRLMQRMLERSGYDVVTAANGRQAADILSSPGAPRLSLIDWMMPELDGPGLCREIRGRSSGSYIYILLLTSKQSSLDVVNGLRAGADDYLTKPCHPAELEARLNTGRRILQLEDKLVEAREEMRFQATHDVLTNLWNRAAILTLLRAELARSIRDRSSVSLLICDVDHFKQVNDLHGHLIGDEVLHTLSQRLIASVRSYDAVGRYGGEEFLIVLSNCIGGDLRNRAEEVRKSVSRTPIPTSIGPVSVSISIGAIAIENWDSSAPMELPLSQADHALYQAKATGRDRVVFADAHFDSPVTLTYLSCESIVPS
jgi:two-component system, cell cycle response regulator